MNTVRFHNVLAFSLHEDAYEYGMKLRRYRVNGRVKYDFDNHR